VLLIVEVVMWRDVKMVEVRDVISGLFARALVWGDVDPHGGGLATYFRVQSTFSYQATKVGRTLCRWRRGCNRSTCLDVVCMPGGWVKEAHACEIVRCLAMR
jgi:hypothetical protein